MMVYYSVSAVSEFNQDGTHRASLVFLVAMSIPEHGDLLYPQKVNFQLITLKISWVIYPCEMWVVRMKEQCFTMWSLVCWWLDGWAALN